MYNFTAQKDMFVVANGILDSLGISKYALGGGTALSAFYWKHRYSTDIDIFIFEKQSYIQNIREALSNPVVIDSLQSIGYQGNFKYPGNYLEIEIDDDKKIQFFERAHHRENAFIQDSIWGIKSNIECIDEIIYKKIYFRGEKCNTRDLFDIAIAINKNPSLFKSIIQAKEGFKNNLVSFLTALSRLVQDENSLNEYKNEISYISPAPQYKEIASTAPQYLADYLSGFLTLVEKDILDDSLLSALENQVYCNVVDSGLDNAIRQQRKP